MHHCLLILSLFLALFAAPAGAQTLAEVAARGKAVYDANCASCHGADGKGAAQNAKPLDGSAIVLYDTAKQLRVLLDGFGTMSPFAAMTDLQLADVVTYTKNAWSNSTGVLMAASTVGAARRRGDSCVDTFWSPMPQPAGTDRVLTVESPAGRAGVWWCLLPARQGDLSGKLYWRMNGFPVHKDDASRLTLIAAAGRIAIASDPVATAWTEANAARIQLVPGSQKAYEYAQLQWLGCETLRVTPLPNGTAFDTPLPADYCGPAPVPPPPPPPSTQQYIVSGSVAYALRADGTRSTTAWPTPPIKGESADQPRMSFGVRFCRVPRLSTAAQTVVAGCVLKP